MKTRLLGAAVIFSALLLTACGNKEASVETEAPVQAETSVAVETPTTAIATSTMINPNKATGLQLETMTAVAGANAELVAALREARPFANAQAFDSFLGNYMGEEAREIVYKRMFIPMNLNTTPEADFMIIPGVGKKMAHEFEEYRPYTDMAQFDKEISKYVDAEELARLRQYVTLD